jgi:hypothetical protein
MCVVCVTVAGTVVVASQITPIQVLSDFTSAQKTLTSFAGSSSALSAKQRSEIKVLVDGSPEADAVVCTGLTLKGASRSVITTARTRAKASCDYAKRLNPFLETTVVTRTTSSRTNAGRVTVQVRTPKSGDYEGPIANPSPDKSLQPITPWATELDSTKLGDGAQLEFQKWASSQSAATLNHSVEVFGSPNAITLDAIKKGDEYVAKLLSQFIPGGSVTLISDDSSWLRSRASALGTPFSWGCETTNDRFNYCLDASRFTGYVIGSAIDTSQSNAGLNALPMHEYFHNVQASLAGTAPGNHFRHDGDTAKTAFPAWWLEGTADFVGFVSYAEIRQLRYSSFKSVMMTANPGQSPNANALKDYEIRRGEGNGTIIYPYNMGRIATEYLVASAGFQKILDVHVDYKTTRNFRTSFSKVYGFTVEEFYDKFETIRIKVGLPPVTMEIRGTENLPKS